METWDIIDKDRRLTGRTHTRGEPLKEGDFHLVVEIWIVNSDGKILLSKRHPNKLYPNLWECTGGSVIAGENSAAAAIREVREEIGIALEKTTGKIIFQYREDDSCYDVWLFRADIELSATVPQEGEVTDVKFVTLDELKDMFETKQMVPKLDYIMTLIQQHVFFSK